MEFKKEKGENESPAAKKTIIKCSRVNNIDEEEYPGVRNGTTTKTESTRRSKQGRARTGVTAGQMRAEIYELTGLRVVEPDDVGEGELGQSAKKTMLASAEWDSLVLVAHELIVRGGKSCFCGPIDIKTPHWLPHRMLETRDGHSKLWAASKQNSCHAVMHTVFSGHQSTVAATTYGGKDGHVSHLCHVPACCNPAHLVYESPKNNLRRSKCHIEGICQMGHDLPRCFLRAPMSDREMRAICKDTSIGSGYTAALRAKYLGSPGKNRGSFKVTLDMSLPTTEEVWATIGEMGIRISGTRDAEGLERLIYGMRGLNATLADIKWEEEHKAGDDTQAVEHEPEEDQEVLSSDEEGEVLKTPRGSKSLQTPQTMRTPQPSTPQTPSKRPLSHSDSETEEDTFATPTASTPKALKGRYCHVLLRHFTNSFRHRFTEDRRRPRHLEDAKG